MPDLADIHYGKYADKYQESSITSNSITWNKCLVGSWFGVLGCTMFAGGVTMFSATDDSIADKVTVVSVGAGLCIFGCVASVASCALNILCSGAPVRSQYTEV